MAKDFEVDWREGIGDVFGSLIAGVIVAIGVLMVVVSLLALLAGYGVQKRRQWGRFLTIVLAALSGLVALLSAINLSPFAFFFGGYAIYVLVILLQRKYADEFA